MKQNILRLIQDDIKISRLINTLEVLDISAYPYFINNSSVVFNLMELNDCDELREEYYKLIEKSYNLELYRNHSEIKTLANEIYDFLKKKKKEEKIRSTSL